MNVFFRVDSSLRIGSGHLMRCLTLADFFYEKGAALTFICRDLDGFPHGLIERKGYRIYLLPGTRCQPPNTKAESWLGVEWKTDAEESGFFLARETPDLLIIDHYSLDIRWERKIRPFVRKIMVIDDLANREHDCDFILDQNLCDNYLDRYDNLVPPQAKKLLGAQYALLREEFFQAHQHLRQRSDNIERILLFFGGSDITHETVKALQAVELLNRPEIFVDVVVGETNPDLEEIFDFCQRLSQVTFYSKIDNIAELMVAADLAVGAGGCTTWERFFLKLKSIVISVADNQVEVMEYLEKCRYIKYLGKSRDVTKYDILNALNCVIEHDLELREYEFDNWRNIFWKQLQSCTVS